MQLNLNYSNTQTKQQVGRGRAVVSAAWKSCWMQSSKKVNY